GPDFEPQSHLRSNLERDAKASLSFDQASHEPRIQRGCSIGVPCSDEGRRIARRIVAARHSFRISRYGVTRTSLGITRCQIGREGFPDMSRFSAKVEVAASLQHRPRSHLPESLPLEAEAADEAV